MIRLNWYNFAFISTFLIVLLLFSLPTNVNGQQKREKTYYLSHKIRSITYQKGKVISKVIMFYPNGKKKNESNYDSVGNIFGKQIEYYKSGKKKSERFVIAIESMPYELFSGTQNNSDKFIDVITCRVINFFENGSIMSKGYIVNSFRGGYWVFYNIDGTIKNSEFYKCLVKDE
ncbi:MAG: hypothetical protein QM726_17725 [Chitinophagaceae bacterium]